MVFNRVLWGMSLVTYTWFGDRCVVPEVEHRHWLLWLYSGCCGLGDWPAQDDGHCGIGVLDLMGWVCLELSNSWMWSVSTCAGQILNYSVGDLWHYVLFCTMKLREKSEIGPWKAQDSTMADVLPTLVPWQWVGGPRYTEYSDVWGWPWWAWAGLGPRDALAELINEGMEDLMFKAH